MKISLARAWIIFSVVALLSSGVLALVITAAKIPSFKDSIQDLNLIRWCLIVHVNLATLVWFTALPAGLIHLAIKPTHLSSPILRISWLGFSFAVIGFLMMMSVPPRSDLELVLANYIPVIAHPRYYAAIVIYLIGVLLNYVPPFFAHNLAVSTWKNISALRVGLAVGAGYFVLALVALSLAYFELIDVRDLTTKDFFEAGMWGGGHLLQHTSAIFLVCAWMIILSRGKSFALLTRWQAYGLFALFGLPLFITPFLLTYSIFDPIYREGFTYLMRFGIAPGFLLAIFFLYRYRTTSTTLSAFLLTLGFVFGGLIRGTDLRIPGHYHAEIGAVTLAFMVLSFQILAKDQVNRWMTRTIWTYGIGQTLFAGGMFMAGTYGIGRKTYGSEHNMANWGQGAGFTMMVIGGLGAFAGGFFYYLAIKNHLRLKPRSSVTNSETKAVLDSFEVTNGFISTKRSINQ